MKHLDEWCRTPSISISMYTSYPTPTFTHTSHMDILNVAYYITSVSPEGSVTVEAVNMTTFYDPNETATLNCMASGGPNNTFVWFLDAKVIENEVANTLTLSDVEGGEYTCQVSNAAGSESASITLTG